MKVRLDRAIKNASFVQNFHEAKLFNVEVSTSDHSPLLLEPAVMTSIVTRNKKFKFENSWLREPLCKNIVEDSWRNNVAKSWQENISACASNLGVWGLEITRFFRDRINFCKKVIKKVKGRRDEASISLYQE